MSPLELLEDEYVAVSSERASLRELLELAVGAVCFVLVAGGLAWHLLGRTAGIVVAAVLTVVFTVTVVSQAYWAVAGREDYRDDGDEGDDYRNGLE